MRSIRQFGSARRWWTPLLTLGMGVALALSLGGCGAAMTATAVAPTVKAVATTVAPTVNAAATTVATNIPPGAGATAAVAATSVASAVPGLAATAAAGATTLAPTPGTGGPQATVTGQVTAVDPNARTFTVQGSDGRSYNFTVSTGTQVDFTALATSLASKQQVTITYRNTTSPYEVISVR